jgi:hypothetical protein
MKNIFDGISTRKSVEENYKQIALQLFEKEERIRSSFSRRIKKN